MTLQEALAKPRMRGVLHTWAAPAVAVLGLVFLLLADGARERTGVGIWAAAATALFAVSATYHRGRWRPAVAAWMQRADHSMIFVMIAGSYTPICLLVLEGAKSWWMLSVVWGGALLGVTTRLLWHTAPKWMFVPMYISLGWVAAVAAPDIARLAPGHANALLLIGGVLYTVGAVVFATKRPDPWPAVFGFHEVFHLLTIAAAVCHAVAIASVAL